MHLLNGRTLFVVLAASFAIATACGGSNREFPGGGAGSGDAGDSSEPGGGSANRAGNAGTANHAGSTNHAGTTSSGGNGASDAGTGTNGGDSGAGGEPATPECGAPGTPCCDGNVCIANAACMANACKCAATFTACSDACVDLQADGKNCGACGHSCLGGTCDLGSCQPVTVATGQSRTYRMATDGKYLYWTGSITGSVPYYVARRSVDSSGTVKIIAPAEASVTTLTVSNDKVYWVANGHLRSCDLPDCVAGPKDAIAYVSSTNGGDILFEPVKKALYWSSTANYDKNDGTLYALAAGAVTPTTVGANPSSPGALARDGANVYWINSSTYNDPAINSDGALWRLRISDGATTQLAAGMQGDISYLAVSGTSLYFAGSILVPGSNPPVSTSSIIRAPLPNGLGAGTLPKFADAKTVRGMLADAEHLYFGNDFGAQSTISRCPIAACPAPETIVPALSSPYLGAQDSVSIYWSFVPDPKNAGTLYNIQRLAK